MSTATASKPKYQLFGQLCDEEFAALENDILARGIMVAVEVDEDGNILDGHHRAQIAEKHGLEYETVVRHFENEEEKQVHCIMLNLARRHLMAHEWGAICKKMLAVNGVEWGKGGDRKSTAKLEVVTIKSVAAELGIPLSTVEKRLRAANDFRKLPPAEQEAVRKNEKTLAQATRERNGNLALKHSGCTGWYTPAEYIERVRKVMGGIDLDPASCEVAQKVVKAGTFYTEADDGLNQEWSGKVFLNPPFKQPAAGLFIGKLCDEYEAGNVTEAVLLTNNNTDTRWWQRAAGLASSICYTAGRISFYNAASDGSAPTNGQTFCYFGKRPAKFRGAFGDVGICLPGGAA